MRVFVSALLIYVITTFMPVISSANQCEALFTKQPSKAPSNAPSNALSEVNTPPFDSFLSYIAQRNKPLGILRRLGLRRKAQSYNDTQVLSQVYSFVFLQSVSRLVEIEVKKLTESKLKTERKIFRLWHLGEKLTTNNDFLESVAKEISETIIRLKSSPTEFKNLPAIKDSTNSQRLFELFQAIQFNSRLDTGFLYVGIQSTTTHIINKAIEIYMKKRELHKIAFHKQFNKYLFTPSGLAFMGVGMGTTMLVTGIMPFGSLNVALYGVPGIYGGLFSLAAANLMWSRLSHAHIRPRLVQHQIRSWQRKVTHHTATRIKSDIEYLAMLKSFISHYGNNLSLQKEKLIAEIERIDSLDVITENDMVRAAQISDTLQTFFSYNAFLPISKPEFDLGTWSKNWSDLAKSDVKVQLRERDKEIISSSIHSLEMRLNNMSVIISLYNQLITTLNSARTDNDSPFRYDVNVMKIRVSQERETVKGLESSLQSLIAALQQMETHSNPIKMTSDLVHQRYLDVQKTEDFLQLDFLNNNSIVFSEGQFAGKTLQEALKENAK